MRNGIMASVLTQTDVTAGVPLKLAGGVIFTSTANADILQLTDIKDRRLEVSMPSSLVGVSLCTGEAANL